MLLLPVQDLTTFYKLVYNYLQIFETSLIFSIERLPNYIV